MSDTARYSTLHQFAESEKRSRLVRKSVSYSFASFVCEVLSSPFASLLRPGCADQSTEAAVFHIRPVSPVAIKRTAASQR